MEKDVYTDETLMAYADGELDARAEAAVSAAAESDPDIARRIAVFTQTRDLLRTSSAARLAEPLPAALEASALAVIRTAAARPQGVVTLNDRRPKAGSVRPMALAASIALAVGLAGGYLMSRAGTAAEQDGIQIAVLDGEAIPQALDTLTSGQRIAVEGGEIHTIASFVNADGEFCREFEVDRHGIDTLVSVACRGSDGWQARFAVLGGGMPDTGYAPASSLETLDAYLSAIGAEAPMSLEEEASALAALAD